MKTIVRVVLIVVVLALVIDSNGQNKKELKTLLDSVIVKAKASALNTRMVKWDSLETEMYKAAKTAKSVSELRKSFEILLVGLNDRQGIFYNPLTMEGIAGYPSFVDPEIAKSDNIFLKKIHTQFEFHCVKEGVNYLRLAPVPFDENAQKEAEKIRMAIDSLSKTSTGSWIVDLRFVTGGDMNPLIAGIAPLLGEGLIGTSIDGNKKIRDLFSVHNGKFYNNQTQIFKLPSTVKDLKTASVVVLTSRYTSGAGEVLAVMFKGRKHTRFIGERTAGVMAGTNYVKLSRDLVMSISETQYHDRKGAGYKQNIKPDSYINFEQSELKKDKALTEATYWLTQEKTGPMNAAVK